MFIGINSKTCDDNIMSHRSHHMFVNIERVEYTLVLFFVSSVGVVFFFIFLSLLREICNKRAILL